MKPSSFGKVFAITALSTITAFAGARSIGVASSFGSFTVGASQVNGSAEITNGSQITTDKLPSQIALQNGTKLLLATNSSANVYSDRLVLFQGAARLDQMGSYGVEALGIRVIPDTADSAAAVRLNAGAVEVASIAGTVKVFGPGGAMLTRVGAGTASSFKPQSGAGGQKSGGGAVATMTSGNTLLYVAIIAGLAGVALGAAALVNSTSSYSAP
jgi:hypothetical protein